MSQLVLASQSEARQRLLKRLGVRFQIAPADLDEAAFQESIKDPRRLVEILAQEKAKAVAERYPRAFIIGSDQALALGRQIFGKPGSQARAVEQLERLSGKTARLLTAVCVLAPDGRKMKVLDEAKLVFRSMTRAEISAYVRADRPFACAGSFKIEERGITLFRRVETQDPSGIEGLPLIKLAETLRRLKVLK